MRQWKKVVALALTLTVATGGVRSPVVPVRAATKTEKVSSSKMLKPKVSKVSTTSTSTPKPKKETVTVSARVKTSLKRKAPKREATDFTHKYGTLNEVINIGPDDEKEASFVGSYGQAGDRTLVVYIGAPGYKYHYKNHGQNIRTFDWIKFHNVKFKQAVIYSDPEVLLDMQDWFRCFNIEQIKFTPSVGEGKVAVKSLKRAFYGCDAKSIDFSALDTSKCTDFTEAFACNKLNYEEVYSMNQLSFNEAKSIEGILKNNKFPIDADGNYFAPNWNLPKCTNADGAFSGCNFYELTLQNLKFGQPCSVKGLLKNCNKLGSLKGTDIDASNFTDMSEFIRGCTRLDSLDTSKWNLKNATKMDYFAQGNFALKTADLEGLRTATKLESAQYLMADCSYLKALIVNGIKNDSIKTIQDAFSGCSRLRSIDLSDNTFSALERCDNLLAGCSSLTYVFIQNFNAPKCESVAGAFSKCKNLGDLDLSGMKLKWDKLNIYQLVNGCSSLAKLNLEGWELATSSGEETLDGTTSLKKIYCPSSVGASSAALCTDNGKWIYVDEAEQVQENLTAGGTLTRKSSGNKPVKLDVSKELEDPYPEEKEAKDKIDKTDYTLAVKSGDQSKLPAEFSGSTVEVCNGTEFVVKNGTVLAILSAKDGNAFIPSATSTGTSLTAFGDGTNPVVKTGVKNLYVEAPAVFKDKCFANNSELKEVRIKTSGEIEFGHNCFNGVAEDCSLIIENASKVSFTDQLQTGSNGLKTVKICGNLVEVTYNSFSGVESLVFDNEGACDIKNGTGSTECEDVVCSLNKMYFIGGGNFTLSASSLPFIQYPYPENKTKFHYFYLGRNTELYYDTTLINGGNVGTVFNGADGSKLITSRDSGVGITTRKFNLYDLEIGYNIYTDSLPDGMEQSLVVRHNLKVSSTEYLWLNQNISVIKVYGTLDTLANNTTGLGQRAGFKEKPATVYVNKLMANDDGTLPEIGVDSFGNTLFDSWYVKEIVNTAGEKLDEWKFADNTKYFNGYYRKFHMPDGCTKLNPQRFQQVYVKDFDMDLSKITEVPATLFRDCKFNKGFELCFDKRVDWKGNYTSFSTFEETSIGGEFRNVRGLETMRFKDGLTTNDLNISGVDNFVFDPTETTWNFNDEYLLMWNSKNPNGVSVDIGEGCTGFSYDSDGKKDGMFGSSYDTVKLPASFDLVVPNDNGKPLFQSKCKTLVIADGNPVGYNNKYEEAGEKAPYRLGENIETLIYSNTAKNFSNQDLEGWSNNKSLKTLEVRGVDTAMVNKAGEDMTPSIAGPVTIVSGTAVSVATGATVTASAIQSRAHSLKRGATVPTNNEESYFWDLVNAQYDESTRTSALTLRAHDNSRFNRTLIEANQAGIIKPYNYETLCDYHEVERVEPTYESDGYVLERCDECGAIRKTILPMLNAETVVFSSVTTDGAITPEAEGRVPKGNSLAETDTIQIEDDTVSITGFSKTSSGKTFATFGKKGYDFKGWYANSNLTTEYDMMKPVMTDTNIYAKLSPTNYKITYHPNGGTIIGDAPNSYNYGDTKELPKVERKGYTFDGWYQGENFDYKVSKIEPGDWGDLDLYAKWKLNYYEIKYDLDGGSFPNSNPSSYTVETEDLTIPTPVKPGNNFKGWTGTSLKEPTKPLIIKKGTIGDKNYKATWEVVTGPAVTATPPAVTATPAAVTGPAVTTTPPAVTGPAVTTGPTATATPAVTVIPTEEPEDEPTSIPWDDPNEPTDEPTEEEENLDDPTPKSTEKPKKPSKTPRVTKKPDRNNNTDGGEPTYRPVHSKEPVKTPQTGDNYSSTLMIAGLASGLLALISALTLVARRRFRRR